MDRGIFAIWYDLAREGRTEYLDWLHGTYLPDVLRRPGYLWAAHYEAVGGGPDMTQIAGRLNRLEGPEVGTGTEFVLIIGAASAHVFFSPNVIRVENPLVQLHPELADAEIAAMAARRLNARHGIFAEQERVNGPEIGSRPPGTTPAPAIQFGSFNTRTAQDEFDLTAWYAQYRFPAIARMPGCIGARKFVSVAGVAKHCILYEYTSLEARLAHFEVHETAGLKDDTVWTNLVHEYTVHAPGSPAIARRIWPEV